MITYTITSTDDMKTLSWEFTQDHPPDPKTGATRSGWKGSGTIEDLANEMRKMRDGDPLSFGENISTEIEKTTIYDPEKGIKKTPRELLEILGVEKVSIRLPVTLHEQISPLEHSTVVEAALFKLFEAPPSSFPVYRDPKGRKPIEVTISKNVLKELDDFRGELPRARVIIRAVEQYLKNTNEE